MNQPTLTPSEAALVRDLLKLHEACWDAGPCRRYCRCVRCEAMNQAGGHDSATFDSLAAKVGGGE